jgi:hypothetical protein
MSQPQDIYAAPLPKKQLQSLRGHEALSTLASGASARRTKRTSKRQSKQMRSRANLGAAERASDRARRLGFSLGLQDGTGRDCLEADRLPLSIGQQLAGLDQSKNPATPAVRREAEEDWGGEQTSANHCDPQEKGASMAIDAEIEAAVVAIRAVRVKGAKVHEEVMRAYARAAVEAAEQARKDDFQRRAQLNNKPTAPTAEVARS